MNSEQATVVLVHGAWHGAWCWDAVSTRLDAAGVRNVAVDNPSVAAGLGEPARRRRLRAPTCSTTIGGPGARRALLRRGRDHRRRLAPSVAHLVYLTAFVLDVGEGRRRTSSDRRRDRHDAARGDFSSDGDAVLRRPEGATSRSSSTTPRPDVAAAAVARLRAAVARGARAAYRRSIGVAREARDLRRVHRRPRAPGCAPAVERGAHRAGTPSSGRRATRRSCAARRAGRDPRAVRRGLTARRRSHGLISSASLKLPRLLQRGDAGVVGAGWKPNGSMQRSATVRRRARRRRRCRACRRRTTRRPRRRPSRRARCGRCAGRAC